MKALTSGVCLVILTACAAEINVLSDAGTSATGTGAAGGNGTSSSCKDLEATAHTSFNQFLATHQSCVTDDDCVIVQVSPCAAWCPDSISGASAADAVTYSEQLCSTFLAQGCHPTYGFCIETHATCNSGTCAVSALGDDGSGGLGGASATGGASELGGSGVIGGSGAGGASATGGSSAIGGSAAGGTSEAGVGPGCSTTTWPAEWRTGVLNIPRGPGVTSMVGAGPAPIPSGGLVTSGSYWLAAETIYGFVPPALINLSTGVPGQTLSSELAVSCDLIAQAVQVAGGSTFGEYGPLVPHALSGEIWDGSIPYTATSSTLSLIMVRSYGNPDATLGTYTVVDDYVLLSNGVAIGTAPQRLTDDGGPIVSQARDPRCPASAPDAGTACDPSTGPLECEYGGDSLGRCTQSVACALQPDGSYRFQPWNSTGCDPNPASCPASFSAADATSGIVASANCEPRDEFLCNYPEGVCQCGSVSSALACRCITPGYAQAYGSQQAPDGGDPCPAQRPLSGDGCMSEGLWCFYNESCSRGLSLGPSMACMRGYWDRLEEIHPCPAMLQCP